MLSYILKLRLKQIFLDSSNGLALGLRYIMIFLSIAYGVLYGYLLDQINEKNPLGNTALNRVTAVFLLLTVVSFIIKNYFPMYKGSTRFIATIYPVSATKRALGHLINDLTSSLFISYGLFFVLMTAISKTLTWHPLPAMAIAVFCWILVDRNLRRCLDFRLISNTLHLVITIVASVGLAFLLWLHFSTLSLSTSWLVPVYTSMFVVLFIHGLWIDASILESQEGGHSSESSTQPPSIVKLMLEITLRNPRIRMGFITAFGTKLFLGLVGLGIGARGNTEILDIYSYMILSPAFILMQIFMNTFGFYRDFWLAGELYSRSRQEMLLNWFKLIGVILVLDAALSFGLMYTIYEISWHMLLFYVICILPLLSIGFRGSYSAPLYVENVFMNKNSNAGAMGHALLTILLIGIFGVLTNYKLAWTIIPIIVWWAYWDWKRWPAFLAKKGPTVYDKLYK
ncbi:hypothetical protein EP331_14020 [bacterium]|nr:MAG: hypothetical protein EP331_14020 [bacterium]